MYVNLHDSFRLISSYTRFSRWTNALRLYFSWFYSKFRKHPHIMGKPLSLSIEPTTACNLGCPHCPSGLKSFTRPTGKMNALNFQKYLEDVAAFTGYITLYFQGEPYINKEFTDMVGAATAKNIYTATSTNGHFLSMDAAMKTVQSGLKRMIISIDGVNQKSYAKYRIGGQLDTVLEGTKNILEARRILKKSYPVVIWQFIVFKHNAHELEAVKKMAASFGVDKLAIKTAQVYDFENADNWLPEDRKLSRYEKKNAVMKLKSRLLNHCWRMWSGCVITWDGAVVPCCFDKDAEHMLGNLNTHTFDDIWKNAAYAGFRNALNKGRENIGICTNCSEGTRVWL